MHYANMAEHVRSKGRGEDTMLIHMTPHEVGGLQALAMAHGGSLTINPETGLPEAGWLGKLLPTILGGLGMAFGIPPVWMGALGAVGGTAITGNLKEGLMAGLGAFGGASLAGAAGVGTAGNMISNVGGALKLPGAVATDAVGAGTSAAGASAGAAGAPENLLAQVPDKAVAATLHTTQIAPGVISNAVGTAPGVASSGLAGLTQNFGNAARMGLTGTLAKAAAPLATMGVLGSVSNALTPTVAQTSSNTTPSEYGYTGPYTAHREALNPYASAPNTLVSTPGKPFDPTNFDSSAKQWFGPLSYTDAAGNPWVPGQKTTPTAANANSAMAHPVTMVPAATNNPNSMTAEQQMQALLQQYQGYADGGEVTNAPYHFPIQAVPQAPTEFSQNPNAQAPQPDMLFQQQKQQLQQGQPQDQSSPYMPPSAYGRQQNNPNGLGSIQNLPGLAAGGTLHMRSGSFVMPARETAEFGNGSSSAGQQVLAKLGGTPIHGPGDGVSDSIHAQIDGHQKARVARDEVHFAPEAVARLGGGNHQKGTQKLYALMAKAQKARKSAKRGQDTGLGAIA